MENILNMFNTTGIIIIFIILLFIVIYGYSYIYKYNKKIILIMGKDYVWVREAFMIFIFFGILSYLVRISIIYTFDYQIGDIISEIFTAPFAFSVSLITIIIGIWISTKLKIIDLKTNDTILNKQDIKGYVENLWNSQEFLSTLRTVLPKGNKDEENGLDYIPFMLHNIDEQRKRYKKTSESFLKLTIVLGFIFSLFILYFGYILINNDSIGISKNITNIEDTLIDTQEILLKSTPQLDKNILAGQNFMSKIENLKVLFIMP